MARDVGEGGGKQQRPQVPQKLPRGVGPSFIVFALPAGDYCRAARRGDCHCHYRRGASNGGAAPAAMCGMPAAQALCICPAAIWLTPPPSSNLTQRPNLPCVFPHPCNACCACAAAPASTGLIIDVQDKHIDMSHPFLRQEALAHSARGARAHALWWQGKLTFRWSAQGPCGVPSAVESFDSHCRLKTQCEDDVSRSK